MLRPRVIPCLLLRDRGLVKTWRFGKDRYLGDPLNAVRIFNEKEVDEIVFLDIDASRRSKGPDFDMISRIASECFMPFAYGGGITSLDEAGQILALGAEKIVLTTSALNRPDLISQVARKFGSQSVVGGIDVKRDWAGKWKIYNHAAERLGVLDPMELAKRLESSGAGEIFLQNVDRDGTMSGLEKELIAAVSRSVNIPIIACGGAANLEDLKAGIAFGASAVAAGSLFVFYGKHKAVLLNYPDARALESLGAP